MAGTEIDVATLNAAAEDCNAAQEAVRTEAGKVRSAKENVAARWKGSAANTFGSVIEAWLNDTNKLLEALQGISDLLKKTGATHSANEAEQDAMFGQFNAAINR
jgi:WXG100 family type VII secretion target